MSNKRNNNNNNCKNEEKVETYKLYNIIYYPIKPLLVNIEKSLFFLFIDCYLLQQNKKKQGF